MYNTKYEELYHHGILGQKWGVRRYQNPDGSLTAAGQKRYSKDYEKYEKEMVKYQKDSMANRKKLNLDAYNKTVDEYNKEKIEAFNKKHKNTDSDYMDSYVEQFTHDYHTNYDKMMLSEMKSNKHYQKAQKIAEKYNDETASDLMKKNRKFVNDLSNAIDSGKTSWDLNQNE